MKGRLAGLAVAAIASLAVMLGGCVAESADEEEAVEVPAPAATVRPSRGPGDDVAKLATPAGGSAAQPARELAEPLDVSSGDGSEPEPSPWLPPGPHPVIPTGSDTADTSR